MGKIVFYLMNKKAFDTINDFLNEFSSDSIKYMVLSQDKNIKEDYYNELICLCKKNNIKYFDRLDNIPIFKGYKFAIGWRWMIEDSQNLIILHDSILPKYRGYAPVVNMLINKEDKLGVTAIFASKDYDKGDIIQQEKISIRYPIKIKDAFVQISPLYAKIVIDISKLIINNEIIVSKKQDEENASYSLWRDEKDYYINWNEKSSIIRRKIDALGFPYSGAHTYLNGKSIIIEEAEEYPDVIIENRDVGKVIFIKDTHPVIVCGKGLLKIKKGKYLDGESIFPIKKFRSRFGGINYD